MHKRLKKILSNAFSKSFNKNYRPISEPSDFNIMTLGCSNAYGAGLKQNEVFDYIIKSEIEKDYNIKVSNWNLGSPGKGPDHCKIIFNEWAPKLKPNIAIFWWPNFSRYFMFNKITNNFDDIKGKDDVVTNSYIKYISTDEQDIYNWYYNCYLLVENISKAMGIKLLHIRPLYNNLLDDYAEELNFLPDGIMTFIDTVSDTDKHPGKKSHEQSGKNIYKFLKDKGYFDEICI